MAGMKLMNRNRNKITIKNRTKFGREFFAHVGFDHLRAPFESRPRGQNGVRRSYRVSFIPSGISGGGALMRLWLLP